MSSRVLVISNDYVGRQRAGPAIRALELSRQLALAGHDVTLAVPGPSDLEDSPVRLVVYDADVLRELAPQHDVILFQGWVLERFPFLKDAGARLAVDLYDPFPLELLVTISREPTDRRVRERVEALLCLNEQIRQGDFFLCASEKQVDFWLGALHTLNRVNPDTYAADSSLRSLLAIVPFGIPSEPPSRLGPGPREVIDGVGRDDLLLLWGGGVYNWFDPLTLIRAVADVKERVPQVRLVFMAAQHPNPDVPEMWMLAAARSLSRELGLTGRHVFFNERWVPYDERASWLLDSDIGVSTHFDHVETRFSFRTRILDYFWAGLPVISTAGDGLAGEIEAADLGRIVPAENVSALAGAIEQLADRDTRRAMSERVRAHAQRYSWDRAAAPLIRYCADPRPAPDLLRGVQPVPVRHEAPPPPAPDPPATSGVGRLATRARQVAAEEGLGGLVRATRRWISRRGRSPAHSADA
jgi:glycosyltransferase involved in cell wall biosynthesis